MDLRRCGVSDVALRYLGRFSGSGGKGDSRTGSVADGYAAKRREVHIVSGSEGLLSNPQFGRAVSRLVPRSERQDDLGVLVRTYVDNGVLVQLDNTNNQILYGRRGTGKSHLLRVLGLQHDREAARSAHVYVDMRLLGSAQMMLDPSVAISLRATSVFRDLLAEVHHELMDWATDPDDDSAGGALEALAEMASLLAPPTEAVPRMIRAAVAEGAEGTSSAAAELSTSGLGLNLGGGSSTSDRTEVEVEFDVVSRDSVRFAEVARAMASVVAELRIGNLFILIDEWSHVPRDVQPFLAELIRHCLLPLQGVTLKIGALEFRSDFSTAVGGQLVGFEVGADIAANIDLDDYFVYDKNPSVAQDFYLELLFRHLHAELGDEQADNLGVANGDALRKSLFTGPEAYIELVRAAEGVVRDLMGILTNAFVEAGRSGRERIDIRSVEAAARSWYETDKAVGLNDVQKVTLSALLTEVIGNRQARSFLINVDHADDERIQSLFDARVLHLVAKGYSDKSNPGLRYNIYSLDYGTYVDLKRTAAEPELGFAEEEVEAEVHEEDRVVPFDDKRSIRRIVLTPEVLDGGAT